MTQAQPNPPTLTHGAIEFGDAFVASLGVKKTKTANTYSYALSRFARFIATTKYMSRKDTFFCASDFRDDILLRFYNWLADAKQEYSPATLDLSLAAATRFLVWLDAHDHVLFSIDKARNRLKAVREIYPSRSGREADPGVPKIVTYYDDQSLPSLEPRNHIKRLILFRSRAIVHTLYASAGRVSEVASLTRDKVLDGRKSEVRITGKGSKDRLLLLTKEAQRAIASYCRERHDDYPGLFISHGRDKGKSLGRGTLWAVVKKAAKALDLYKGTSPHSFRHYRAQELLEKGMEIDVLQTYLGHADIGTTRKVYAPHTSLPKVRRQLEAFGLSAREAVEDSNPHP